MGGLKDEEFLKGYVLLSGDQKLYRDSCSSAL